MGQTTLLAPCPSGWNRAKRGQVLGGGRATSTAALLDRLGTLTYPPLPPFGPQTDEPPAGGGRGDSPCSLGRKARADFDSFSERFFGFHGPSERAELAAGIVGAEEREERRREEQVSGMYTFVIHPSSFLAPKGSKSPAFSLVAGPVGAVGTGAGWWWWAGGGW